MDAINASSWEDFELKLKKLREENGTESSPLLYRGQGNSEWHLDTTLERYTKKNGMTFLSYYDLITGSIGPEVRTFSGVDVPERRQDIAESFFDKALMFKWPKQFPDPPLYGYMAHLRQLGFPSPLLDWSRSPYVAAFFAFREDPVVPVATRSIYAYCSGTISGGTLYKPMIVSLGPYVHTHHRHFRQRSEYTFCGNFVEWDAQWRFDSHEKVFENRHPSQDLVWKFDIPSGERDKVLGILSDYNLNAFSLFGSEESLLETMWYREYPRQTKPVMVQPLVSRPA
jgi:FRG domain-containing protein